MRRILAVKVRGMVQEWVENLPTQVGKETPESRGWEERRIREVA